MHLSEELRSIAADVLVDIAIGRGATWPELVKSVPGMQGRPRQPDLFRSHGSYAAVIETTATLMSGTDIGLEWGRRSGLSALGTIGLTIMGASTCEDVLRLWSHYKSLMPGGDRLGHTIDRGWVHLHRRTHEPRRQPSAAARLQMERHLAWCASTMSVLTSGLCRAAVCRVPWRAPPYAAEYHRSIADRIEFGSDRLELVFPQTVLDMTVLSGGSTSLLEVFRASLDHSLSLSGTHHPSSVTEAVSQVIERLGGSFRTLEEVASLLGVSERTIRRMLVSEGVTYRNLLRQGKMRKAEQLLRDTPATIEQVSLLAGFENTTSFRKAFKQWTGLAPSEWRRHPVAPEHFNKE